VCVSRIEGASARLKGGKAAQGTASHQSGPSVAIERPWMN